MRISLRMCAWPTCRCCRQLVVDEDARVDVAFDVAFFGCRAFAICPGCFQEVEDDMVNDRNYRRRAQRIILRKEAA